ncbi:hypothetical protein ACVIVD_003335 [Bradyrhizobium liaoningense]
MHEQDAGWLEAFCFRERDIVLLQGRDHVGAQHPHDARPFRERQRQGRQHEEAQIRKRLLGERHIAGRRQPVQLDREQIDQQDRGEKRRHRQHGEGAAGHEAVEGAAGTRGAGDRNGNADQEPDEFGHQHQLKRDRDALGDCLQHSLPGAKRTAEIALQHVAEPAQVTPPQRLIQPHVTAQRRDILRRRLIAEDDEGEIARQQRGDQEGEQRDGQQNRQDGKEPPNDEVQHRVVIPARCSRRRSRRCRSSESPSAWRSTARNRCSGRSRTRSPPC